MKVLLDENLDRRLRRSLGSHEVFTASYKGWSGLKNGRLLEAAEKDGIDVLLTGDKSLYKEQNLAGRRLAIVVMSSVEWRFVKDYLTRIIAAIDSAAPGSYQAVTAERSPASEGQKLESICLYSVNAAVRFPG